MHRDNFAFFLPLLVLANAVIFRSESRGKVTIFHCLRFETLPTWRARLLYLCPSGTGWSSYMGTELPFPYSPISSRHGPRTENTAPLLLREYLLGFPCDRYPASPLAPWLLPSNRKHSSSCCVLLFRAWSKDGCPSTVVCTSVAVYLPSHCLPMLWANPSQYVCRQNNVEVDEQLPVRYNHCCYYKRIKYILEFIRFNWQNNRNIPTYSLFYQDF
jgi:hypothetical protein